VDFGLFFVEEANQLIVLLDGLEGFDEDGLTGGGRTVNDAGNLPFELGFDGYDEAVTPNCDEVILGAAAFGEAAERFAEAFFDSAMLALHRAADTAELVRGVVVEGAVRFDFATKETEDRSQVVVEQWGRELGDAGPVVTGRVRRRAEEIAPGGDVFDDIQEMENLQSLKCGAIDAGFVKEIGGIEEAGEAETAATGEHGPNLSGTLLLFVNPGKVGGRVEGEGPGSAKRRGSAGGDVVAKAWPLEGLGA
jgi:hypothetical protein